MNNGTEINISFQVENEYNEMTSAFGIEENYTIDVIKGFKPKMTGNQNLFITGESGSGKSLLLKRFGECVSHDNVPTETLIQWPEIFDISEKYFCQLLSGVGLCDAKLFTRDVSTFSDSQRYRSLLLFSLIKYDTIILDEFLSTLDRESAKPIAFAFQKICRKLGKRFVVASAHSDITEYLKPDVVWTGEAYTGLWKEEIRENEEKYPDEIVLEERDVKDVRKHWLLDLHYIPNLPGGMTDSSVIMLERKEIGIILLGSDFYARKPYYIRRMVIHPSYRGCGFSKILINNYINKFEELRVLSKIIGFNDLFNSYGNVNYYNSYTPPVIKNYFKDVNFNWNNKNECDRVCMDYEIRKFLHDNFKKSWARVGFKNTNLPEDILTKRAIASSILFNIRPRKTPSVRFN